MTTLRVDDPSMTRLIARAPLPALFIGGCSSETTPAEMEIIDLACDPTCLVAAKDAYLAALAANDPSAAHIFKVGADGTVHEIEPIGFVAPFNSAIGWE